MEITAQELKAGKLSVERLAQAARAFRDSGIVTLEKAYPLDFIAAVRAAFDVELEKHIAAQGGMEALQAKTFGKKHVGFFPPLFLPLADARLAAHPIAVQIMTELLGPDLQCSFYHTNTAFPGSGYQPIHRDTELLFGTELAVPLPVATLVLNIPLCDFTEENGSTEYWPGSHLLVDSTPEEGKALEARAAGMPSIRTNMPAGSFALRDMRGWHRGVPNRADYHRPMLAIVYKRGWLAVNPTTIPKSTWDAWPDRAKHIFRNNKVVPDAEHRPATW